MSKTHAAMVDEVEALLEDSSNGVYLATEVADALDQAIREMSSYSPHVSILTRELESRTGFDTAGTSGSLSDDTESQFLAGDVGKVIFNPNENTWAIVVTFTSTSVLVLSRDIMNENDQYVMYNPDCWSPRQLYLGDIPGFIGINEVQYPTRGWPPNRRNFTIQDNVLTVLYDGSIPDSDTTGDNLKARVVDVDMWVKRQHKVSRMTDLAGLVDLVAGYSRGDTSMVIDTLTDNDAIAVGQEFFISPTTTSQVAGAGLRGRYRCTAAKTVTSSEAIVAFWPPLENDVSDDWLVTFVGSTLDEEQERLVVDLCAGRMVITKAALLLQEVNAAISSISSGSQALALVAAKVSRQVADVANARTAADLMPAIILEANTEIDKIAVEVGRAITALTTGGPTINRINKGGPNVLGQYATAASQNLNAARGRAENAQALLSQVSGDAEQVQAQLATGAGELAGAQGSVNNALGYLEKGALELQTGIAAREFRAWGRDKVDQAIRDIRRPLPPKQRRTYSRV